MLLSIYSSQFIEDPRHLAPLVMEQLKITRKNTLVAIDRALLVIAKKDMLDESIKKYSPSYDLERVTQMEMNILRLAVYEILFDDATPDKVAISEAVRLARKFSTPDGGSFVNGILDAIYTNKHKDASSEQLAETSLA